MAVLTKQFTGFYCPGCDVTWWYPQDRCCPRCGQHGPPCIPDPYVYEVHQVIPGLYITGMMRDSKRFERLVADYAPGCIIDLAGDYEYVWRPRPEDYEKCHVHHVRIDGVHDNLEGLDHGAISLATGAMTNAHCHAGWNTIVHCAAGLSRAPHFVYAYMRILGRNPVEAWDLVERARERSFMVPKYIDSIESYLCRVWPQVCASDRIDV